MWNKAMGTYFALLNPDRNKFFLGTCRGRHRWISHIGLAAHYSDLAAARHQLLTMGLELRVQLVPPECWHRWWVVRCAVVDGTFLYLSSLSAHWGPDVRAAMLFPTRAQAGAFADPDSECVCVVRDQFGEHHVVTDEHATMVVRHRRLLLENLR